MRKYGRYDLEVAVFNQAQLLYCAQSLYRLIRDSENAFIHCDDYKSKANKSADFFVFFRFRRHHFGHECQRQSPSTLVRHDQESRPSPCQDPLLECQLHRLIDTTNCYYIYFFSLHATLCHNEAKAYIKSHYTLCVTIEKLPL